MTPAPILAARARAAAWLSERSERERLMLAGLATLAVLVVMVSLVWRPLLDSRADARARIHADEALIAQLRASGPRLAAQGPRRTGPASAIVTDSAAEAGLTIQRLEPDAGRTRVTLEDAEFERVLRWLDGVERGGRLRIDELKLERRPAPGVVNAQVTLVGG